MPANNQESNTSSRGFLADSGMSWTIEYIEDRRFVKVVTKGDYNVNAHRQMLEDILNRDFWRSDMNLLIDDSSLNFSRITLEVLREAAAMRIEMDARLGGNKTAILVNSLVNFGRVRQFELITGSKISAEIRVFQDENEAIGWLIE